MRAAQPVTRPFVRGTKNGAAYQWVTPEDATHYRLVDGEPEWLTKPSPLLVRAASALLALYKREPARINGLVAAAVAPAVLRFGLSVDDAEIYAACSFVLPLVAAELTRRFVTPTATADRVVADEVRDIEAPQYAEGGYVVGPLPIVGEGGNPGYPAPWQPVNPDVRRHQA